MVTINKALPVLRMLALGLALAVLCVHAQAQGKMTAHIPFDFTAGEKQFPSGEYEVKASSGQTAVLIQSPDRRLVLYTLTNAVQANKIHEKPKLVFNRYGDQYFLSQIWPQGGNSGRQLLQSRSEQELVRQLQPRKATTVTLSQSELQKTKSSR